MYVYTFSVKCPVGTFFNVVSESCSGCAIGTYQPQEGSVSCLVCPVNTTTDHNNSKTEDECKGSLIFISIQYFQVILHLRKPFQCNVTQCNHAMFLIVMRNSINESRKREMWI